MKDEDRFACCEHNRFDGWCQYRQLDIPNGYAAKILCKDCPGFRMARER